MPQKPFTIILDWFTNPTHAPILIAKEKGFFKAEGLTVNIVQPADPMDTAKMVAIGKADIGIGSDPELLLFVNQGLPLVRVGALIDQPLAVVAANPDANINRLSDLKHKSVGYSVGGVDKVILSMMLQKVGLNLSDVKLVNVHYNLVEALTSGQIDAITGALRNYEIPELQLQKFSIIIFKPQNFGVPDYAELNYIINPNSKHDPRLVKFFAAIQKATVYIKNNPEQSWQIMVRHHPALQNQLDEISWRMTYRLFADDPSYTDKKKFTALMLKMQQTNWLNDAVTYSQCVVTVPLPATSQSSARN